MSRGFVLILPVAGALLVTCGFRPVRTALAAKKHFVAMRPEPEV